MPNKAKGMGVLLSSIYTYTIVFDPLENFRTGLSHFGKQDFEKSLEDGTWPTGMIVEGSDGKRFRVAGVRIVEVPKIVSMPPKSRSHHLNALRLLS